MMSNPPQFAGLEAGLADTYTPASESQAHDLLEQHYGLRGKLKRFAAEKDDTFGVEIDDGRRFVLKIANPGESLAELDFQNSILHTVAQQDPDLPTPRVMPNVHDQALFTVQLGVGGACQTRPVRLLSFLDGTPLDQTQANAAQRREIGKVLARLRLATAPVSHPADNRVLAWDVRHLASLAPLLDNISDPAQHKALSAGLQRFQSIAPKLQRCRRQVLHNDFSRSNIVVDHNVPTFITGIIDFGDAVKTAIAVDVSTALLNQLPREPLADSAEDIFADGRDVLDGYLSVADLNETELWLIPHLVMSRVVARALITTWRAMAFPANQTYILRNTEQSWHQLAWFLDRSMDQVSTTLLDRTSKGLPL